MNTLDRYIFKELLKLFVISAGGITLLLYLDKFWLMAEMLVRQRASVLDLARMVIYLSPAYLAVTVPMSVLLAVVVVFNQFSSSNEWTAMKVAQWSFVRLLKPVSLFSFMGTLLTSALIIAALPWGNQSYKTLFYDLVQSRGQVEIQPHVFNTSFKNLTLFAGEKKQDSHFKQIFIASSEKPGVTRVISAEEGIFQRLPNSSTLHLRLKSGTIHETREKPARYQMVSFDHYDLMLDLPNPLRMNKNAFIGNRELSPYELVQKIKEFKQKGLKYSGAAVELSKKFSIPFACLVFGLLGISLGLQTGPAGKSGGFALSIAIILAYYFCLITSQDLGRLDIINPYLSVWIPNAILLAAAIYSAYKLQKEIPFTLLQQVIRLGDSLLRLLKRPCSPANKIHRRPADLRYNRNV